jgi:Holliday junction resolvase RusA-like endonuclease
MTNFFIEGIPVPQGRPRFSVIKKRGGGQFVNTYDPPKSKAWKKEIEGQLVGGLWRGDPVEGVVRVRLMFFMPRPKSLPKKTVHHIKKPDIDNLVKGVLDAMTGICFKDDSQIVDLSSSKHYLRIGGDVPGIDVDIWGEE